ncbi:hypothetical protein G6514_004140 [Epicoccum nigrum]|nr:hypothetical protein G6514_004140 [Epicoccum nigrum]
MTAYQYDELPPDAFRYLVLQPGLSGDPLCCSLHISRIDEIKYESVSYAWGTGQRDQDIVCDDKILKITPNLYSVLQRVRLPDAPRNLWADSICINQEDLEEKGRQVTIMGQIYRSAERVLICMGATGEEHGPNVLSLLQDISKMIDDGFDGISELIEGMERDGQWGEDWNPWDQFPHPDASAPVIHDPRWASINILVEQQWFQRGWVVREAGLAQQGLVIWGQTEFLWTDLMQALVWRHRRAVKTILIPAEDRFRSHLEAYEARNKARICVFYQNGSWKPCSLLDYLHFARALLLKDPRDRIYAFLDLSEDDTRQLHMVPNYNDSPEKVYRDFATNYVRTLKNLEILHYVKHDERSLQEGFMSWAPDWSKEEGNFIGFISTAANYPPLLSRDKQVPEPMVTEGGTLEVKGVIVDSICFASEVLQSSTTTPASLYRVWTSARQSQTKWPYRTAATLLEPFLDVLAVLGYYGDADSWYENRTAYMDCFERLDSEMQTHGTVTWDQDQVSRLEATPFHGFISAATSGKRFIVTERGYVGLAPAVAREGDACAIIFGCCSPCILREGNTTDGHIYLGSAIIAGRDEYDLRVWDPDLKGFGFISCLGVEESKDWLEWDVEEQVIRLV